METNKVQYLDYTMSYFALGSEKTQLPNKKYISLTIIYPRAQIHLLEHLCLLKIYLKLLEFGIGLVYFYLKKELLYVHTVQ